MDNTTQMDLTQHNIYKLIQEVKEKFGKDYLRGSTWRQHRMGPVVLYELAKLLYPGYGTILEIGTKYGIGSTILSDVSDKIRTYDIKIGKRSKRVWEFLGVSDRIDARIRTENRIDIKDVTLTFIDGDHSHEGVRKDFLETYTCACVIFHDYHNKYDPGIDEIVREVDYGTLMPCGNFAVWRPAIEPLMAREIERWATI